jgi:cytochrome P450
MGRVVPKGGKVIDGHYIPGGTDVTSYSYVVQRDKSIYGDDADEFRPERWMVSEKRNSELEAVQFGFGMGPRVCLGRDITMLELHKLLPEVSSPVITPTLRCIR